MSRVPASWVVLVTALAGSCGAGPAHPPAPGLPADLDRVKDMLVGKEDPSRLKAIRLASTRKLEPLRPELAKLAEAPVTAPAVRRAAVEALVALGGRRSADVFRRMARGKQPYAVRVLGVAGLAALEPKEAAARAAEVLTSPEADRADLSDLFAACLRREGGDRLLAAAMAKCALAPDVAKLGLRSVYSAGRPAPELEKLLRPLAAKGTWPEELTPGQMKELAAEVAAKGNPARGEEVFRRKELACLSCHSIAGAGGRAGPDLTGVGKTSTFDALVESILAPSRTITKGYETIVVTTDDGRIVSGVRVRDGRRELVLRDARDQEVVIPRDRIEERRAGPSLMPAGLADPLTRAELVDLLAFLSRLGRPGPYGARPGAVARRWRVLDPVPVALAAKDPADVRRADLGDAGLTWVPAYSTVGGTLPLADLPTAPDRAVSFARAEVRVTRAGEARLKMNPPRGLSVWLDDRRVSLREGAVLDLPRGLHALTFRVDHAARGGEGLRVGLARVAGSEARFEVVAGR
jgi:putative heme-binding domain-containing protein